MNGHPHGAGGGPAKPFHRVATRPMTPDENAVLLESVASGRLGTTGPDGPYVVPLAFAWHEGAVVFHCHREGKKLANLAHDDRVCFQADTHTPDTLNYRSVILQGRAAPLAGEDLARAMGSILKKYGSDLKLPPAAALEKRVRIFRIEDARVTGKCSEEVGRKEEGGA